MITYAIERFDAVYAEMSPLLEQHYREISSHYKHGVPLKPQVAEYRRRQASGALVMVIGREAGKIAAYMPIFIGPGLHYETCLTATVDIFYVAPERRGFIAGVRMFRFAMQECKRRGVQRFTAGSKFETVARDAAPLLRFVGLLPVETIHEAWL